jgi:hypothetical protein
MSVMLPLGDALDEFLSEEFDALTVLRAEPYFKNEHGRYPVYQIRLRVQIQNL